jgi:6-phosphogluconolactonase
MMQAPRWFYVSVVALVIVAVCGCGGGTHKVLYAVGLGSPNVAVFQVNGVGALKSTQNESTGSAPNAIGIDPMLRFAYVVDSANGVCAPVPGVQCGGVSQYTLSAGTGALAIATLPAPNGTTPPSTPIATGQDPRAIAIDPTGTFAFVASRGSNPLNTACNLSGTIPVFPAVVCIPSISAYTIDPTGGALTEVKQTPGAGANCVTTSPEPCPLPTATNTSVPNALAATAGVVFVAITDTSATPTVGSIATYTFNSSGQLQGPASSMSAGVNPVAMTMDSRSKFLFVADQNNNSVAAFSISSSGQLTAVGSAATGTTPVSVHVVSSGRFLFTANQGSNNVSAYTVDGSGALTQVTGSPFSIAPGTGPSYVTTDVGGTFLFVANRDSQNISVFSIDGSGSLTQVNNSPFPSVVLNPVALASIN